MTKKTPPLMVLLASLGTALGCSDGGDVNIGNNTQSLGSELSDYAATWDGYAEAYAFPPSNSDHIHLVIAPDGTGSIQVGDDPLLPPPTNPDLGYPPDATPSPDMRSAAVASGLTGGVLYPLHASQVQTNRIQIGLKPGDYYAAWCALQTPYRTLDGWMGPDMVPIYDYNCVPGVGGGSSGSGADQQCEVQITAADGSSSEQPVDCGKFGLCVARVCTCDADSCESGPAVAPDATPAQYPAELDAALDDSGTSMTGTLNVEGMRITVHLQRQ